MKLDWENSKRNDIIKFNPKEDTKELISNIKIGKSVNPSIRDRVTNLVESYWDCFATKGARRTIIGYEFGIDTGSAKHLVLGSKSSENLSHLGLSLFARHTFAKHAGQAQTLF